MSLTFHTGKPEALYDAFNDAIDQDEAKGRINTWRRTENGAYTHIAHDWTKKAYFRAEIVKDVGLRFRITPPVDKIVDPVVYAYFHGHLTETFVNHFPRMFDAAVTTSTPAPCDRMRASTL